jgi:hypothetical protein
MYKLIQNKLSGEVSVVQRLSDKACIPFDPANTDFQQFKSDLADGVELQDADGNTMTAEEVAEFVATLP